jgi:hypothetical protein
VSTFVLRVDRYVEALRENCVKKKIQGACDVLNVSIRMWCSFHDEIRFPLCACSGFVLRVSFAFVPPCVKRH